MNRAVGAGGRGARLRGSSLCLSGLRCPWSASERDGRLGPVDIVATGLHQGQTVVRQRAVVTVPAGQIALLRMYLLAECEDVLCPGDETCRDGRCVQVGVDPSELEDWPGRVDALDGGVMDGAARDASGRADAGDAGSDSDAGPAEPADAGPADAGVPPDGGGGGSVPDCSDRCAPECQLSCPADGARCRCQKGCKCDVRCLGDDCTARCEGESTSCKVNGSGSSNLRVECQEASCVTYAENSSNVEVFCSEDSRCVTRCESSSNCTVRCEEDARCLLYCRGASNCGFEECEQAPVSCGGSVVACGTACP